MSEVEKLSVEQFKLACVDDHTFTDEQVMVLAKKVILGSEEDVQELATILHKYRPNLMERFFPKVPYSEADILRMWPQAASELKGFQRHLEAKSGITASQLGMALQLAEVEFKRLQSLSATEQNPLMASTKIEPKEIENLLRERCNQVSNSEGTEIDLTSCYDVDRIGEGLTRVSFDFENYEYTQGSHVGQFHNLLGPRYFGKVPAVGCAAGGDWEYPVFFIVYMDNDGATLRSYVPKNGNTWNHDSESAFGNDEKADIKFLVRWAKDTHAKISPEIIEQNIIDHAMVMFDEDKIIKDIEDNIQPK